MWTLKKVFKKENETVYQGYWGREGGVLNWGTQDVESRNTVYSTLVIVNIRFIGNLPREWSEEGKEERWNGKEDHRQEKSTEWPHTGHKHLGTNLRAIRSWKRLGMGSLPKEELKLNPDHDSVNLILNFCLSKLWSNNFPILKPSSL